MWLTSVKECAFSLFWPLCALTALTRWRPCTSSPALHGPVTALRSRWGDRNGFWLLYVDVSLSRLKSGGAFHLWQKGQWTERALVECGLPEYQIAHYIYSWHPLSGLSWTQQTLRPTDPIWKSAFRDWTAWVDDLLASIKVNMGRVCKSSRTSAMFFFFLKGFEVLLWVAVTLMAGLHFRLEQRKKSTQGFLRKYPVSSSSNRQRCAVKVYCSAESHWLGSVFVALRPSRGSWRGDVRQIELFFSSLERKIRACLKSRESGVMCWSEFQAKNVLLHLGLLWESGSMAFIKLCVCVCVGKGREDRAEWTGKGRVGTIMSAHTDCLTCWRCRKKVYPPLTASTSSASHCGNTTQSPMVSTLLC